MAVAYADTGIISNGSSALTPAYPPSLAAGDLLCCHITSKYPANPPSTPAGWTLVGQVSGGNGAAGADSGDVLVTIFSKIADGTESGTLSVSIPLGNSSQGRISRWTKSATATWDLAFASGTDTSGDTSWSVTAGSNPGITAGDVVFLAAGVNCDGLTVSSPVLAATGLTLGASIGITSATGTSGGDDCASYARSYPITSGTASAAPTFTATFDTTAGSGPAGVAAFVRIREIPPIVGAVAQTLAAATASGTGAVGVAGALLATLGALTATATGVASVLLEDLAVAAAGTVEVAGALNATLGALTVSAAAATYPPRPASETSVVTVVAWRGQMSVWTIKEGATHRALERQILHNGRPVDLSDAAGVTFRWMARGVAVREKAATIVDAQQGRVRVVFGAEDFAAAGRYACELVVAYDDGSDEVAPSSGWFHIGVTARLA